MDMFSQRVGRTVIFEGSKNFKDSKFQQAQLDGDSD